MSSLKRKIFKISAFLTGICALNFFTPPLLSDFFKNETPVEEFSLIQTTRQQLSSLAAENKNVLKLYDELMGVILEPNQKEEILSEGDLQRICSAILFAASEHQLQTRKNKEKTPYISHPLEVTYHLVKIGEVREVSLIIAAILHDTAQGKKERLKEINKQFGSKVATLVKEVSSHPVSAQEGDQRDLMIQAPDQSLSTVQIELADLLCSLNELTAHPPAHWKKEKVDHFFEWAQSVLDRFPHANQPLHDAVEEAIETYWNLQ